MLAKLKEVTCFRVLGRCPRNFVEFYGLENVGLESPNTGLFGLLVSLESDSASTDRYHAKTERLARFWVWTHTEDLVSLGVGFFGNHVDEIKRDGCSRVLALEDGSGGSTGAATTLRTCAPWPRAAALPWRGGGTDRSSPVWEDSV